MTNTNRSLSFAHAAALDAADPLAHFREEFVINDPQWIYLDGNSLGRLPKQTLPTLQHAVQHTWGDQLVRGWGEGWYDLPTRLGEKIARMIGAQPGQVICADSTSVNLYKVVTAALAMRPDRAVILTTSDNFPSDIYILQGCAQAAGKQVRVVEPEQLVQAIDSQTALVALSNVAFKSGMLYDAAAVTRHAHDAGAWMCWDLCHSVGVVPVALDDWGADFAVGCTYKYLNGGPGAPAFLYARRDLLPEVLSPIWGWFGEQNPFAFDLEYHPGAGIERFLAGTPPVLSMLAAEAGVEISLRAGIAAIRAKSIAQTGFLWELADALLVPLGFAIPTPRNANRRGSHVSLQHSDAYRINRALIEDEQVLPDFREPDVIRLGLAPLYTTYQEVWEAVQRIRRVTETGAYQKYDTRRSKVT